MLSVPLRIDSESEQNGHVFPSYIKKGVYIEMHFQKYILFSGDLSEIDLFSEESSSAPSFITSTIYTASTRAVANDLKLDDSDSDWEGLDGKRRVHDMIDLRVRREYMM